MRATEESKVELFPLYIHSYGDNNFRVIRKWGRSVMVTRQQGLEVIELLGRGAKLKEVRTSLAQKYGCESSKIDLSPLLTALRKANLIKSVDGEKICKNEVTASTFLEFFLRFYLFRTVNKYSRKYLPISILRKVLYLITFFQLRKATREKVENAAKNMMVVLGRDSDRKIGSYRKDYYRHLVKNIIDIDSLMPKSPTEVEAWLSNNVSYVGLEHLDRAIKSGKGVLLCGFHFTSVRLIPLVLMRRGYSFTTMGAINLHL
ncbi:MAG: hypothetical protein JNN15_09125, partial [Blastocatellia bacterium]|nr:hypothetical protein [Blastocatellia bacterium]